MRAIWFSYSTVTELLNDPQLENVNFDLGDYSVFIKNRKFRRCEKTDHNQKKEKELIFCFPPSDR